MMALNNLIAMFSWITRSLKCWMVCVLLVEAGLFSRAAESTGQSASSSWEHSVVTIEVSRKKYDYYQPWTRRTSQTQKTGLVLGEHQILTTADEMFDRTLVRLQKNGRGRWYLGELTWIDYHANLALVTTVDPEFWNDLKPVVLKGQMPSENSLQILRWRNGNLENRHAEFNQFIVREGQLSSVSHVSLEADCDIQGAGWGEPVVANSHVIGIVNAQAERTCIAIPASFINDILEAKKSGKFHGLGYFHFYWQPAANPASLARLKLTGDPRGVIVIQVPDRPDGAEQVLKPQDIILQIDGFNIDIQGDYEDPEYGHLMLENLSSRSKFAGDDIKMKIWRDGKALDITYHLPKYDYSTSLVPMATYDREPEYLMIGGLVFQPLSDSYLQSWGNDWKRRAPFRLTYYRTESPDKDRPALVVLSQVLPDPYNIGYQDQRCLVVDKVNGQRVSRLPELRAALDKPVNGFHVIEFIRSDSLRKMVLLAGDPQREATTRVLKRYGIDEPLHFAPDSEK